MHVTIIGTSPANQPVLAHTPDFCAITGVVLWVDHS